MTTTQTAEQSQPPTSGPRTGLATLLGAAFALLAFPFGAYVMLPAAPLIFFRSPALKRFAASAVLCSLGALLLSMAGLNPVLILAREQALAEMEAALGARPTYAQSGGSPAQGLLTFSQLQCELPDVQGELRAASFEVELGYAFLWPQAPVIRARGIEISFAPSGAGLRKWSERMAQAEGREFGAALEDLTLKLKGPLVSASAHAAKVNAHSGPEGTQILAAPDALELTVNRQTHSLKLGGGVTITRASGGFGLKCDVPFANEHYGRGLIHGELRPDFSAPGLKITLDRVAIGPIWARYAQWSEFTGDAQGALEVAGNFDRLVLRHHLTLSDLNYFHSTAMALDRQKQFSTPKAEIYGELAVIGGSQFEFIAVTAVSPDCAIATDPAMNARGPVRIVANGIWPNLKSEAEITVASGGVIAPLEFTRTGKALGSYEPNCIPLVELLPVLDVSLKLKLEKFTVNCEPLSGSLKGELKGSVKKAPGEPFASVRLEGELPLRDGRVEFCAARCGAEGKIIFNPHVPPDKAMVRGTLKGAAGEVPLEVEITGSLTFPWLVFTNVKLPPEQLGRHIMKSGVASPAEEASRMKLVNRMCGVFAATKSNPFLAGDLGEIAFVFKP